MPRPRFVPPTTTASGAVPFEDSATAWFWAVRGTLCRHEGARMQPGLAVEIRPCEPVDVMTSVERLARSGRLHDGHVRVLVDYGLRDEAPNGLGAGEARDRRLWEEALDRLHTPLATKGIVRCEA